MFEAYSTSHLVVLGVFVAGVAVLLAIGPAVRGRPAERTVAVALAVGNIAFGVAGTLTELVPFDATGSLPLQVCDFAWIVVAWALLTRHRFALALTYYLLMVFMSWIRNPYLRPDLLVWLPNIVIQVVALRLLHKAAKS